MNHFLKKIRLLVAEDQLEAAVEELNGTLSDEEFGEYHQDLTLVSSKLKTLNREKRNETISRSDYELSRSRIRVSILELAQLLDKDEKLEAHTNKILKKKPSLEKTFMNNGVMLREIDNNGVIKINYNRNVVRTLLAVIVGILVVWYLIWPNITPSIPSFNPAPPVASSTEYQFQPSESSTESMYYKYSFQEEGIVVITTKYKDSFSEFSATYKESEKIFMIQIMDGTITLKKIDQKTLEWKLGERSFIYKKINH